MTQYKCSGIRTNDLKILSLVLYQLSYASVWGGKEKREVYEFFISSKKN